MSLKISELKKELAGMPNEELVKLTLRLAKLKVENKELLHYLLFYSNDNEAYAESLLEEILDPFRQDFIHPYAMYKRLRKSMKIIAKYLRFTSDRAGECDLLLALVNEYLKTYRFEYKNAYLVRIIFRCLKKTADNMDRIHEDYRADYIDSYNQALKSLRSKAGINAFSDLTSIEL
jgi:hypothetical protein